MLEKEIDFHQEYPKKNILLEKITEKPALLCDYFDLSKTYSHSKINFDLTRWKIKLIELALSNHEKYGATLTQLLKLDSTAKKMVQNIADKKPRLFFGTPNKEAIRKYESALLALKSIEKPEESVYKNAPSSVFFSPKNERPVIPSFQRGQQLGARVFKSNP